MPVELAAALLVAVVHLLAALEEDADGESSEVCVEIKDAELVKEEPSDAVDTDEYVAMTVASEERDVLAERDVDTVALSLTVTLEEREDDGLAAGDVVTRALSEALGDLRDEDVADCDDDTDGERLEDRDAVGDVDVDGDLSAVREALELRVVLVDTLGGDDADADPVIVPGAVSVKVARDEAVEQLDAVKEATPESDASADAEAGCDTVAEVVEVRVERREALDDDDKLSALDKDAERLSSADDEDERDPEVEPVGEGVWRGLFDGEALDEGDNEEEAA